VPDVPSIRSATREEQQLFWKIYQVQAIDIVSFSRFVVGITILSLQKRKVTRASTDYIRAEMDRLDFPNWDCFKGVYIHSRGGTYWCTPRSNAHTVISALRSYSDRFGRHLIHHNCKQATTMEKNKLKVGENCTWNFTKPICEKELFNVKIKM